MPRAPGAGDQQHVGVPRAGGEEDPQPVDVVDRVEQGQDLPFLGAVGSGVHVPQVHRPAQRAGPARRSSRTAARPSAVSAARARPGPRGGSVALAGPAPAEGVRAGGHAAAALHAAALIQPDLAAGTGADRAGRAQGRQVPAGVGQRGQQGGRAAGGGRAVVGARGPAGGQHAVAQAPQSPRHRAAPATDRPKLASMNGKSVRMSPANTSCIRTRLWKEADRARQRLMRPRSRRTS